MDEILQSRFRLFNDRSLQHLRTIDVFEELIVFLRMFLTNCGMDILQERFRWNFRTFLCLFCLISFSFSVVHTVYLHWGDWYAVMDSLSVSGIGLQGMIKMYSALAQKPYFREKYLNIKYLHQRSTSNPKNNASMIKCVLTILYLFRMFFVSYAIAGVAFFVLPFYVMVVKQEKKLVLPLELPFTEASTETGYVITTIFHLVLTVMAIMGILAADMGIMIIVLHVVGIANVFMNNLGDLNEMLLQAETSDETKRQKFTEICIMHKEILQYEEDLDGCYHHTVFVQVITSVSCLSLTLFVIYMTRDWTRLMFMLATFIQLLEFCMLGTTLRVKNDHIIDAIYDCNWYLLSSSDKLRLGIMLHRAQNPVEMTIGGLSLLNMETFVEIMKTIYSYFAMMISFLD
ncbi:odorant receptor 67d-like [Wyeomyia smithii]|uniref:odorant receptor 67d-like n=1 Tax=Wyeomyia smithii TaxID=174621 RepID=UPI0024681720|nr:odorant receptor 67d-like [Wyeomyia smithii]